MRQIGSRSARRRTGCASANTLGVVPPFQQTVNATHRKLEASLEGARLILGSFIVLGFSCYFSLHCVVVVDGGVKR